MASKTPKKRSTTAITTASRKVRTVARISPVTADPTAEVSWITVNKPRGEASDSVTVSFREQSRKEFYELDYCYEQHEDNGVIYSREVKNLIPGVLKGCNATVIALGARGSGKTSLIQGSSEKPGLAALAVDELISEAENIGSSITISSYEVYQDHIYDILDPLRPEVFVLGDTQGNIRLKGLSKVPVKSMLEFCKLYVSGCGSRKPAPKGPAELSRRAHKGLIIYVSSPRESSDTLKVSKLNFVDLSGYEDTRRKSIDCFNHVDNSKINKSIYAVLKVVHSLSATGNHVPYRENKLTHLLQDSLGGMSRVLTITCLKPFFCQDSIYMLDLVSRSSQNTNQAVMGSTTKSKGLTRSAISSSHKHHIHMTSSATAKKQTISRMPLSDKNVNRSFSFNKVNSSMASGLKGRKLFDERSRLTKSMKEGSVSNVKRAEQLKSKNPLSEPTSIVEKDKLLQDDPERAENVLLEEMENLLLDLKHAEDNTMTEKDIFMNGDGDTEDVNPSVNSSSRHVLGLFEEVHDMEEKNDDFLNNEDSSPPISTKLQEVLDRMKSVCASTLLRMPEEKDDTSYIVEPKTPTANQDIRQNDTFDVIITMPDEKDDTSYTVEPKTPANQIIRLNDTSEVVLNSPWQTLSAQSTSVKHIFNAQYLDILNTGSKDQLKQLKGIGEKRANAILELRDESPMPFKNLDDLQEIGLSAKQIKNLVKKEVGRLYD